MSKEQSLTNGMSGDSQRLVNALSALFRSFELKSDQLLPATIVAYDRVNNIATVQPLIMWVDMQNNGVPRNEVAEVPVMSFGGGGFHVSFPLKKGDLGWIYAADRDLSLFKQSLKISKPNTGRAHRFDDSVFVPDVFRQYTINAEDAAAMVIQSVDGNVRISIRGDNLKITAPSVVVDSPTTTFTGNVNVSKTLTATTDVVVNGISVKGHGHTSSSPGTRTSGGMLT